MSAPRLSRQTLSSLPNAIARPAFDPARLTTGIVHLGLGAFARAHLASYTDPLLASDSSWGICGVSLRSPATRDALTPQDFLYIRAERDGAGETLQVMGALTNALVAPQDPAAIIRTLVQPSSRIVTISVSEKGYHRHASDGELDEADSAIRRDLDNPATPLTVPGILVAALRARRNAGIAPFTVLCCDNLPHNGESTCRIVLRFAELLSPDLARSIADTVAFPNTMVDRIVPAVTAADKQQISSALGMTDAMPVVCEPFSQWVIEDHFPSGRPQWERSGVELVTDVRPYETMKLRLLNGSHSAIAYFGQLAGWETVADAMRDPMMAAFVAALMAEAETTLRMPADVNLAAYRHALVQRFLNPALQHRTAQIAMDGSQKLPMRIFATAEDRLAKGLRAPCMALVTAAWLRFLQQRNDNGSYLIVDDPNKDKLFKAVRDTDTLRSLVKSVFAMTDIVPTSLTTSESFQNDVLAALTALSQSGARKTLMTFNKREEGHEDRVEGTGGSLSAGRVAAGTRAGAARAR
jgi:fructuronate reductase